ncbi:hypothetical protein ACKFKF_19650 [Phormidesmis sp. 146-12]
MITVKTMKQIATSRVIPGCRAANHLGGLLSNSDDRARIASGMGRMRSSQARRQWLNRLYQTRTL